VTRGICTTNNRFKRSRIFDSKTKIKFHSRTGNTWFTSGIEVWSADRNVWIFFDSHGYERKQILFRNMVFGLLPTPAKHVLLLRINLSQVLNIHQGLKISYTFTHKQFNLQTVSVEHWQLNWQRHYVRSVRSLVRASVLYRKCTCISKIGSFWKLTQLSKRTCDHFVKIKMTDAVLLCQFSRVAVRFKQGSLASQRERGTH